MNGQIEKTNQNVKDHLNVFVGYESYFLSFLNGRNFGEVFSSSHRTRLVLPIRW